MGSSYQTLLVAGGRAQVRRGLWWGLRPAAVLPVGEHRWAVVPRGRHGYAETTALARRLSLGAGVWAARFEVFDSDFLSAEIYSDGQPGTSTTPTRAMSSRTSMRTAGSFSSTGSAACTGTSTT